MPDDQLNTTIWQPIDTVPLDRVVEVRNRLRHPRAQKAELLDGSWWAVGQLGLQLSWTPLEWRDLNA